MALLRKAYALPKSTKVLLGVLICTTSLIFFIKVGHYRSMISSGSTEQSEIIFRNIQVPYLQLIPRYTIFYPWVIVASIFAEITIISFIISGGILAVSTKYVEKFWGFKEVVKFVLIVGSITNLATVIITILCNLMRGDLAGMDKPLGGGISYYFGFLVVLKQLIPEHNIVLFQGLVNFRVKHLPFILLNVVVAWSLLISRSLYPAVPSIGSFVISYNYLRFYQSFLNDPLLPVTLANGSSDNSGSLITGDASDAFQLVEFFPTVLKPYLSVVFDGCYDIGCILGIITPFNDDSIEQGNIRAQKRLEQANQAQKSVANSVAERRRQVALQVIEDRINKESRQ